MFKVIDYQEAVQFLLPRHYSGRKPVITHAFGYYIDDKLRAVCTFGKPASNSLCVGVCGSEFSSHVYELNRLCVDGDLNEPLSKFVAWCLKQLKPHNLIIVSYADKQMKHTGYIYQATNFYYTGATKSRTDKYVPNGKHSRHYAKDQDNTLRRYRSSKHRYIYFACDRQHKKLFLENLNYPIEPYPKEPNERYELGDFIQPIILKQGEKPDFEK